MLCHCDAHIPTMRDLVTRKAFNENIAQRTAGVASLVLFKWDLRHGPGHVLDPTRKPSYHDMLLTQAEIGFLCQHDSVGSKIDSCFLCCLQTAAIFTYQGAAKMSYLWAVVVPQALNLPDRAPKSLALGRVGLVLLIRIPSCLRRVSVCSGCSNMSICCWLAC